jgi:hypothetical protein
MKHFNNSTSSIRYYVISGIFATILALGLIPVDAAAGHDEATGPRFCLIIKPEIKEAAQVNVGMVKPASDPLAPLTSGKIKDFFTGSMTKLGFGVPKCFFINDQIKNNPVVGSLALHADPYDFLEGLESERAGRDFFPNAGFFSRSSQEGRIGMALGLGFSGASPSPLEQEALSPGIKAGLMFGIGF